MDSRIQAADLSGSNSSLADGVAPFICAKDSDHCAVPDCLCLQPLQRIEGVLGKTFELLDGPHSMLNSV